MPEAQGHISYDERTGALKEHAEHHLGLSPAKPARLMDGEAPKPAKFTSEGRRALLSTYDALAERRNHCERKRTTLAKEIAHNEKQIEELDKQLTELSHDLNA